MFFMMFSFFESLTTISNININNKSNAKLLLLTMLTSEMESILAIFILIPTMTGGPTEKTKREKKVKLITTSLYHNIIRGLSMMPI